MTRPGIGKIREVSRASVVTAGLLLATVAAPAQAVGVREDGPVSIAVPDVEVVVGGAALDPLGPSLWSTTGVTSLTEVRVVYELRGAAGVRLTPGAGGGECTRPAPARVVCTDPRGLTFEGETVEQYLPVVVTAARSAEAGDTGTVTVTFSASGLTPVTGVGEVRVVAGQDTLPVTGSPAGPVAVAGLLLLGAGAAGVLATGRRRARSAG
ncbi:hypothetical protein BJY16_006450 [Actinoplanes octamycinicus]|uniref:LPXTG-motif cell wall-anchored protein n=1 Tax=Actinoplanes octamycinicus TaxID=135948 RepID=A0A7W7H2W1_9ACTN|nr:hypothetical protein [Actinoplanes octamycinicus]MBB4742991.1 hypothetical protein [Actinoplanes octamycinicus]GIE58155.1 hypothetical protein Aoc01nite_35570 [Actinoplanes octamycinicus]